jgi:hypothetical protein
MLLSISLRRDASGACGDFLAVTSDQAELSFAFRKGKVRESR